MNSVIDLGDLEGCGVLLKATLDSTRILPFGEGSTYQSKSVVE